MRDATAGVWVLGIVLTFMAIFIAYVSISINYSKAYSLKSELTLIVEQYNGVNTTSVSKMNKAASNYGYTVKGMCETTDPVYVGILNGFASKNPTKAQNICIYREYRSPTNGSEGKYYYTVQVFLAFDLPILGNIFDFKIKGTTNVIYYPYDAYFK